MMASCWPDQGQKQPLPLSLSASLIILCGLWMMVEHSICFPETQFFLIMQEGRPLFMTTAHDAWL
jgi:hypothetical protein